MCVGLMVAALINMDTLWPLRGISIAYILTSIDSTKYNEFSMHFSNAQKQLSCTK